MENQKILSDPFLTAILTKRFEFIVREMTHTLYNSARSAIINNARDFSCCLTTGQGELLEVGESIPIHTYGSHYQAQTIYKHHDDVAEGDAYLHNSPYMPTLLVESLTFNKVLQNRKLTLSISFDFV